MAETVMPGDGLAPGRDRSGRALAWRPGPLTLLALGLNLAVAAWMFSPALAPHRGVDSRVFYAAGRLAAGGGNPYELPAFFREQVRLFDTGGAGPGDETYVYPHTYANPPLFTELLAGAARLPWPVFYWSGVVLTLGACWVACELLLSVLGFRRRWWPRLLFLASAPVTVEALFGNTAALLLLSWSAGLWLITRRRELAGGAVLSLCLLKPTVGLLVAGALIWFGPGRRALALTGFAAGALGLLALDLALTGAAPLSAWSHALAGYGSALTGAQADARFGENISGLAGATALLIGPLGRGMAIVVGGAVVLAGLDWMLRAPAVARDPYLRLALAVGAALAFSPYLHFDDLVLAVFPILVLASRPLNPLSTVALAGWSLVFPGRLLGLAVVAALARAPHLAPSWWNLLTAFGGAAGIGAWMTALLMAGLAGTSRGPHMSLRDARGEARDTRRQPALPA